MNDIIVRPRVVERIATASLRRVALMLAPAGYGKSRAVQQYLAVHGDSAKCFDDGAAFLVWSAKSLASFTGTIALDGLERFDHETLRQVVASICDASRAVRWIIASRSALGLPVGTWLAYRECDIPIGASELAFTRDEFSAAARQSGLAADAGDLRDLLAAIDGWPAAVHVALQAFAKSNDRREAYVLIRDAGDRFWAEQVYVKLDEEERKFLAVAAALPEIDVNVLERAGFGSALHLAEQLRLSTGLLHDEGDGLYRCPEPFLDFLRRRTTFADAREREAIHTRAAGALEAGGNIEAALTSYVTAHSESNVVRLLESNGFDLLERGRSEVTSQAIDALSDTTRRTSPRILALRGVLQALAGNPVRAEVLLRRSLALAKGDRDLAASATLRLALLLTNRGVDVGELLAPIAHDTMQSASCRAEALSLLAAHHALQHDAECAKEALESVEDLLPEVDVDSVRAKVLQRVGVAAIYIGNADKARDALVQAAELAMELQLYSLASRAYANLSNLMLHRFDDVSWQLWYAEQASVAALKAGDAFDVETASLQLLDAELRSGEPERTLSIESQLATVRGGDQSRTQYLIPSKALRLAWEGNFAEAHRLLAPCWNRLHHDVDRVVSAAECALFLAVDRKRDASIALLIEIAEPLRVAQIDSLFAMRSLAMARVCCSTAEAINGRFVNAERFCKKIAQRTDDAVVTLMAGVTAQLIGAIRDRAGRPLETIPPLLERLAPLGYAHLARLLDSVRRELISQKAGSDVEQLTFLEVAVLKEVAEGLSPKEIANRRGRSVLTVRKHIANAISKLRCNGLAQAVALSRRMGILD